MSLLMLLMVFLYNYSCCRFTVSSQLAPLNRGSLHLEDEIFIASLLPTMKTFLVSHLHAL